MSNGANFSTNPPERKPNLLLKNVQINGANSFKDKYNTDKSYYAQILLFGDVGQGITSELREFTKSTKEVEDIITTVAANSADETNRDFKAYDIGAKVMGISGKDFAKSDAFKTFLSINSDDFVLKTYEDFKTKQPTTDYFFNTATEGENVSDGKITQFSTESFGGKDYFCIKDKEGKIHVFNKDGSTASKEVCQHFNNI